MIFMPWACGGWPRQTGIPTAGGPHVRARVGLYPLETQLPELLHSRFYLSRCRRMLPYCRRRSANQWGWIVSVNCRYVPACRDFAPAFGREAVVRCSGETFGQDWPSAEWKGGRKGPKHEIPTRTEPVRMGHPPQRCDSPSGFIWATRPPTTTRSVEFINSTSCGYFNYAPLVNPIQIGSQLFGSKQPSRIYVG
jgi:hypothetical protein